MGCCGPRIQKSKNYNTSKMDYNKTPKVYESLSSEPILAISMYKDIVAFGKGNNIAIYEETVSKIKCELIKHSNIISKIVFVDDDILISSSFDRSMIIWNYNNTSNNVINTLNKHQLAVTSFDVDKGKTEILSGSRDYSVREWNIRAGIEIRKKIIERNMCTCIKSMNSFNKVFIQCSEDLTLRLWDCRTTNDITKTCEAKVGTNFAISCDNDSSGNNIVTGHRGFEGVGCYLLLWDIRNITEPKISWTFNGHNQSIEQCLFINDKTICTASKDGTIRMIDCMNGKELFNYSNIRGSPYSSMSFLNNKIITGNIKGCIEKFILEGNSIHSIDEFEFSPMNRDLTKSPASNILFETQKSKINQLDTKNV